MLSRIRWNEPESERRWCRLLEPSNRWACGSLSRSRQLTRAGFPQSALVTSKLLCDERKLTPPVTATFQSLRLVNSTAVMHQRLGTCWNGRHQLTGLPNPTNQNGPIKCLPVQLNINYKIALSSAYLYSFVWASRSGFRCGLYTSFSSFLFVKATIALSGIGDFVYDEARIFFCRWSIYNVRVGFCFVYSCLFSSAIFARANWRTCRGAVSRCFGVVQSRWC